MSLLVEDEICRVRKDAVGDAARSYAYCQVKTNGPSSAVVILFDSNWLECGTFDVDHKMLWKMKASAKARVKRRIKAAEPTLTEDDIYSHIFAGPLINSEDVHVVRDGLLCKRDVTIKGQSTILTIAWDSLTNCTAGAIVNAANEGCVGGGGIDGRICELGGGALDAARRALPFVEGFKRCLTGSAVVTIAGDLPCQYVIHAVGPNFNCFEKSDGLQLLASSYKSAMAIAREKKLAKVAFPIISGGIFRGSVELSTVIDTALKSIVSTVYPELERLYFCAFTMHEKQTVDDVIQSMLDMTFED